MIDRVVSLFVIPSLVSAQLTPIPSQYIDASEQIGQYARPAVVRVVAGCYATYSYDNFEYFLADGEIGSGYFVDPSGYVVTNYHVVRPSEPATCRERLFQQLVKQVTEKNFFEDTSRRERLEIRNGSHLLSNINYINQVILPTGDTFSFKLKAAGNLTPSNNNDVAVLKVELEDAPPLRLGELSNIQLQETGITIGYSTKQDFQAFIAPFAIKAVPLGEGIGRADVLTGRLSTSKPPNQDNAIEIRLNGSILPGMAGSPVLSMDGEVVGMMAIEDVTPTDRKAHIIPTSSIQRFMKKAGAVNRASLTDRLYREGLNFFWHGSYKAAKAKFDDVKFVFPYHSEVNWLIPETRQRIAQVERRRRAIVWLIGMGTIAITLALLNSLFQRPARRRLRRKKRKTKSSPTTSKKQRSQPLLPSSHPVLSAVASSKAIELNHQFEGIYSNNNGAALTLEALPFIELRNQSGQIQRFYLQNQLHHLGRDRAWADLSLADSGWEAISRYHAVLKKEGEDYRIYDGDCHKPSRSGIFFNGFAVTTDEGLLLKDGDRLTTGRESQNQIVLTYSNPHNREL